LRYTERQQHCLESMGLVAWVSREDVHAEPIVDAPAIEVLGATASVATAESVPASVDKSASNPANGSRTATTASATNAQVDSLASSSASTAANPTDNLATSSSVSAAATSASPSASIPASTEWVEPPEDVTELAAWLPAQMLSPVSSAGQSLFYAGIETAPLLIVEEADVSNQLAGPVGMSAEGAQLFELMMRAITVPATKRKLCLLASNAAPNSTSATACVQEMIYPETRAVLYLSRRWDSISQCSTSEHHCRLVQSLLPAWRVPHPDILLQRSDYKRQAWHCLQGLQSALAR